MSVSNILSGYAISTSMQYSNDTGLISKTETQFNVTRQLSSGDAVLDYYHNMCSKFPNISFRLSDKEEELKHMNDRRPYFGYNDSLNQVGNNFSELGQVSIDIDVAVIRKMQNDPNFEEEVLNAIGNCEKNYGLYQQGAIRDGMSYTDHCLELDGDKLQESQGYYHSKASTEEELRRMWNAEEYQTKMGQFFEEQKAELIEIYLKMTESCILKKDNLAPSEILKDEEQPEEISVVTSDLDEEKKVDRKIVGFTTFPLAEHVKAGVFAFLPSESSPEDPIIQIEYKGSDGEKKIIDVHVNDIDVESASDMEMFAYLTYQGLIGNKIPNALNNYDAYQRMKFSDGDYYYHDYQNGESRFLDEKINTSEMIQRVLSWMKNINHPDAQMHARMCEDLLAMLNPTEAGIAEELYV